MVHYFALGVLAAGLMVGLAASSQKPDPTGEGCSKLGLLVMSGYAWPTQPGDVDDLRTWCRVDDHEVDNPDYSCIQPYGKDEFGLVKARIEKLSFGHGSHGIENFTIGPVIKPYLKNALRVLLADDEVCAITGNVGFMVQLQPLAMECMDEMEKDLGQPVRRKPMLLGTPAMMGVLGRYRAGQSGELAGYHRELEENSRMVLFTSDYRAFQDKFNWCQFMQKVAFASRHGFQYIKCDEFAKVSACEMRDLLRCKLEGTFNVTIPWGGAWPFLDRACALYGSFYNLPQEVQAAWAADIANMFVPIGFNNLTGYSGVDFTGGFHSAKAADKVLRKDPSNLLEQTVAGFAKAGLKFAGFIMESTEMPVHSNSLRIQYKMPVWDISTIGQCLVRAGKAGDVPVFESDVVFNTLSAKSFQACINEWSQPGKLEPKFGAQGRYDSDIKWYENVPKEEVSSLECTGGRGSFFPPIGRLMENFDVGKPRFFKVNTKCWYTKAGMCFGCPGRIPGSIDCGAAESPCGLWGELNTTECRNQKDPFQQPNCYAMTKGADEMRNLSEYLCDKPPHPQCKYDASHLLRNMTMSTWKKEPQCNLYIGCQGKEGACCPREDGTHDDCCRFTSPPPIRSKVGSGAQCVPSASVGRCFIAGCFGHNGNVHCHGTHCTCDPGYCSEDGIHCQQMSTTSANATSLIEIASGRQDQMYTQSKHPNLPGVKNPLGALSIPADASGSMDMSEDKQDETHAHNERPKLEAVGRSPHREEAVIEGSIPLPVVGFGIACLGVIAIFVATQMLPRTPPHRNFAPGLLQTLVQ